MVVFLFDEDLQFLDLLFALDDYFFGVGEEISNGGGDELVENVELHNEINNYKSCYDAFDLNYMLKLRIKMQKGWTALGGSQV